MIKNDTITLYAIRGLPGSGKTSFAKSLNLNFYEADQYFEKFNNSKFDHKLLKKAHKYCYESVRQELERGNSTIVSNTMTSKQELKEYEDLLTPPQFFRVHRSHLINLGFFSKLEKADGGTIHLKDGSMLPVALKKKEQLLEALGKG